MANDNRSFLVLEESMPDGTIAEHRRARPKAKRRGRTWRPWWLLATAVIRNAAR